MYFMFVIRKGLDFEFDVGLVEMGAMKRSVAWLLGSSTKCRIVSWLIEMIGNLVLPWFGNEKVFVLLYRSSHCSILYSAIQLSISGYKYSPDFGLHDLKDSCSYSPPFVNLHF